MQDKKFNVKLFNYLIYKSLLTANECKVYFCLKSLTWLRNCSLQI